MKKNWLIIGLLVVVAAAGIMFFIFTNTVKPEKYSSVIIDCSNLGLNRGMSPKVLDGAGKEVYPGAAAASMNMKDVVEGGVVTYAASIEDARKNGLAGENPLIIKARNIDGIIKSDPVLADADAEKLTQADSETNFLKERKVIFVQ